MSYNNIKKGEAFTAMLISRISNSPSKPSAQDLCNASTYIISKDGGAFVATTNKGIYICPGTQKIILTSDEMNANRIDVVGYYPDAPHDYTASVIINTGYSNSGASSSSVTNTIATLIEKGYTVSNIARDESGYNYYGVTPSSDGWYVIIKEKTDFSTIQYYTNYYRRVSYSSAWTYRAILTYGNNINLNKF